MNYLDSREALLNTPVKTTVVLKLYFQSRSVIIAIKEFEVTDYLLLYQTYS